MSVIYAVLILTGMILVFGSIFYMSYRKGVWERFYEEFRNTVDEAHIVKTDLHNMLDQSIGISRAMVDGLDFRLAELNQLEEQARLTQLAIQQITEKRLALTEISGVMALPEVYNEEYKEEWMGEQPSTGAKVRVYELARELNMNSKELVVTLQELGFPVNNQLNTLDYEVTLSIRQKLTLVQGGTAANRQGRERVLSIDDYKDSESVDVEALREAHPYLAVRTLQEAGYSICDMAQLLNRGQGEINLIINLINKKRVYA
ncbi:MAG: translation initiation factor IF-2 N-terminal domain-containing protein [Deltaproteobacteria bacterium]